MRGDLSKFQLPLELSPKSRSELLSSFQENHISTVRSRELWTGEGLPVKLNLFCPSQAGTQPGTPPVLRCPPLALTHPLHSTSSPLLTHAPPPPSHSVLPRDLRSPNTPEFRAPAAPQPSPGAGGGRAGGGAEPEPAPVVCVRCSKAAG